MITEALRDYVINDVQHGITAGSRLDGSGIDLHHAFLHDTKPNRKKFPYLIDSPFNLFAIPHLFHMANPSWKPFKSSERLLIEIENSLKNFDETMKTTEKGFDELYVLFSTNCEMEYFDLHSIDENSGLFSHRLQAAFWWIWIKEGK